MTSVEFKLDMPGKASWDGKWSGEDKNYVIVRELDDAKAKQLDGNAWSYGWSDGWRASISARVVSRRAKLKHSDGFYGYDWMVASILQYGKIYADHERPEATP